MKDKEIAVIKKFKSLIAPRASIQDLKVFGSRARGEGTEYSDLDILVVVDYLDRELEKYIIDCAWEAGFPDDIFISPVILTRHQIEKTSLRESIFLKNADKEGIPA